jgi:hypothetical protein
MTRYVVLHKLSRGFKEWEFHGSYDIKRRETVPHMTEEFADWYRENQHQIKAVHSQRMVETDNTLVAFEFHNEDDALMCMLQFG